MHNLLDEEIPDSLKPLLESQTESEFFLEFSKMLKKIEDAGNKSRQDTISTLIGDYIVETSLDAVYGGYATFLAVDQGLKTIGPAYVSHYETREEAYSKHDEWVAALTKSPLLLFRDIRNKTIYTVPFKED